MSKPGYVVVGTLVAFVGVIFALQGFNVLKGSGMSDSSFWAVAGPIIAIAGLALVRVGVHGRLR